jgi:predicted ATPase/class 3 adenylate cyclase
VTALPTGTVTFLFTDIEGSTRLVQALGDRFGEILAEHHNLLREVFEDRGGVEVSTEGDAFFVVFTSATAAVEAAVRAQQVLAAHRWPHDAAVRVRMGVHTGEGVLVGGSYVGLDVHRAARIASAAHGGQVIVSDATRALVQGSRGHDLRLKDLGDHLLKDLERAEHLYQVCSDGLPSDFPSPRSISARPNNLPAAMTPFIERAREVDAILELMAASRLVTLTGPGGTGKTRLGLKVATERLLNYEDGAFAVFLAPVEDPDLVPSMIAATLGLREQGMTPIADSLRDHLSDKHMLLVLDNFEQVVPAATVVSELLLAAPRVDALVTSRARLRVSGEREYPVPPMALPDPEQLPPVEALSGYEAIELFVDRARAIVPNFDLTDGNARAIAEICWRLDGLPLAIELAAARIRLLGPEEMLQRLPKGLAFLAEGARDVPARQQTLRNAIAWSYDLLDEPLRAFFRRLGVFVGGWSFGFVDEVCDPDGELGIDALTALEGLIENNLVLSLETDRGTTRFRMLQTIREFALEVLDEEERASVRRRHAEFFLVFVEARSEALTRDPDALAETALEHDNVRAALRWAIDNSEAEMALRISSSLWRFWMLQSHLAEGRNWLTEVLALRGAAERRSLRGRALMALGSIAYWQNDFEATRGYYLEALEIFRGLDDRSGLAEALYNVGFVHLVERDPERARPYYDESHRIAQELNDERGLARVAWARAMCALQEENWEEARLRAQEALDRFGALDDWFGISLGRFVFYQAARLTGDLDEARRLMLESLDEAEIRTDTAALFSVIESLAALDSAAGLYERALALGGAADAFRKAYGGGAPPPLIELVDVRDAARRSLSDERIAEFWHRGSDMSLDEALALARTMPTGD